jgi:hypothetical protein
VEELKDGEEKNLELELKIVKEMVMEEEMKDEEGEAVVELLDR